MPPKMFIVAGPPGSGKSTAFPAEGFGVACFNADDRAAALNHGSYVSIPLSIRQEVNRLFEEFVAEQIQRRLSLAFETTLRSAISFDQARIAKRAGFEIEMRYLALETFAMHAERIKMRADKGGHSAPEFVLRTAWESSIANVGRAIREMDLLYVYDNSKWGVPPRLLLQAADGEVTYRTDEVPTWLAAVLQEI